jgi:hypothetical protein
MSTRRVKLPNGKHIMVSMENDAPLTAVDLLHLQAVYDTLRAARRPGPSTQTGSIPKPAASPLLDFGGSHQGIPGFSDREH